MHFKKEKHESFIKEDVPHGSKTGRPDFRDMPKCQAKAKSTGRKCKNVAVKGKRVCYIHGGKSTGAKTEHGKLHSRYARLSHGDYSARVKENRRKLRWINLISRLKGYL